VSKNSFGSEGTLRVGERSYRIFRLSALPLRLDPSRLPYTIKVLLENVARFEDGSVFLPRHVEALANWPDLAGIEEIPFLPARVLMQDFTGVPAVADLAAMRDAVAEAGGDPGVVDPGIPVDLVIDHSLIAEYARRPDAFRLNARLELERNRERYELLRWAQEAFGRFRVVPPDVGICHQVNLEYLSRVVYEVDGVAFPDSLLGTDSHTTMVNGLGVLGWGVGGIEAEAAMLGQPIALGVPEVVGVRLVGRLASGATATDLVLTIAERLRQVGVVGKMVEFFGPGIADLPVETRATIANMSPEYGSTGALFPIDGQTLAYLRFTGRPPELVSLVDAYAKEQGLFVEDYAVEPVYSQVVSIDLSEVEASLAGPAQPHQRVPLRRLKSTYRDALAKLRSEPKPPAPEAGKIGDGSVVIAAITSCTNTSNPAVMLAAGLLAKKARDRGLEAKPWVKTSLAPGSRVVTEYLQAAGLQEDLDALGFSLVGYGCTTCIGNSGPLLEGVAEQVTEGDLAVCSVLSGNRNFAGRIHPLVRFNWLASPPLVVAFAIAGSVDVDLDKDPLGYDREGKAVFLADIWPTEAEVVETMRQAISEEMFRRVYSKVYDEAAWGELSVPKGPRFSWDPDSTYVRRPPFFEGVPRSPREVSDLRGARALVVLGDGISTDHISPAGSIDPKGDAGRWLIERGVAPSEFNSYGSRRGNHEVMMRGTFANARLRNLLVPNREGGWTAHLPDGEEGSIFEVARRYQAEGVPLIVLAGRDYGSGSSRDWAAKGPALLGVRAVIAASFERIHRSNLVGMGILPLQLEEGQSFESLGISGREVFDIEGLSEMNLGRIPKWVTVRAAAVSFRVKVRLDTPKELEYFRHGGILPYVYRSFVNS